MKQVTYIRLPQTNYCLTCRRQHGALYRCRSYTLTEQLDLELMNIRFRQQVQQIPFLAFFYGYRPS